MRNFSTIFSGFTIGLVGLTLELSLLREAALVLGPLAKTNAIVISGYLGGIAIGSLMMRNLARRSPTLAAQNFAKWILLLLLAQVLFLLQRDYLVYELSPRFLVTGAFFLISLIFGFLSGAFFLLLLALPWNDGAISAPVAYGVNAAGSVFGGLAHGLVLVPYFGLNATYFVTIACCPVMCLILVGFRPKVIPAVTLAAVGVFILLKPSAAPRYGYVYSRASECGSVDVHRNAQNIVRVYLDRVFQASSSVEDHETHRGWAQVGAEIVPHAKSALLFGLGSGVSAAALLQEPEIERVDVAEACRPMLEVSERFFPEAFLIWHKNPKLVLYQQDFRSFLRFSKNSWDIILIDHGLLEPTQWGYFTEEFFQLVSQHLKPHGIVMFSQRADFMRSAENAFPYSYIATEPNIPEKIRSSGVILSNSPFPESLLARYQRIDGAFFGATKYFHDRRLENIKISVNTSTEEAKQGASS